ncbi:MAG TPA: pyridoxine 5'-phosphate synthase [Candidatus Nitrosopolaris sp.]|nr:pyridoxine 5'-phosphate synthase [Candidatus Nitrosopolaris sp.]
MQRRTIRLGVNVDHVATLRQARGVDYPDPVEAGLVAEAAGADGITVHLREDRRHIQERDVEELRRRLRVKLNLEMAATDPMVAFAQRVRPADACLVPERREELTTEGGLDVVGQLARIRTAVAALAKAGMQVALFIDPEPAQLAAAVAAGAPAVELHTGDYANARDAGSVARELGRLRTAATEARRLGLEVHGGHGLTLANVGPIAALPEIVELNIGHSLVARAVVVGLAAAVREMKAALAGAM